MFKHETEKRVRYAETDKMGYLYYGHYAMYYEIGRVEALRSLGMKYKDMEDEHGVIMPVASFSCKYIRPAYYDELLTIKTAVNELPVREMNFRAELFNEKEELLNIAEIKLAFVDLKTGGRIDAPEYLRSLLKPYFDEESKAEQSE